LTPVISSRHFPTVHLCQYIVLAAYQAVYSVPAITPANQTKQSSIFTYMYMYIDIYVNIGIMQRRDMVPEKMKILYRIIILEN
jgi:hypothetical protein